jgi:hypothetical protein
MTSVTKSGETREFEQKDGQNLNRQDIWHNCWEFSKRIFRKEIKFTTCATLFQENSQLKLTVKLSNLVDETFLLSNLHVEITFEIFGIGATLGLSLYNVVIHTNDVEFQIKLEVKFCLTRYLCTDWIVIADEKVRIGYLLQDVDAVFKSGNYVSLVPENLLEEENPHLN